MDKRFNSNGDGEIRPSQETLNLGDYLVVGEEYWPIVSLGETRACAKNPNPKNGSLISRHVFYEDGRFIRG